MSFLPIRTIFKLNRHWATNVSSRLFTCFHYKHIEKTAPPPGGQVFPLITTIIKLVRDIHITNETNVLTKFHEDWSNNVSSRLFRCFYNIHIEKTALPPGGHVFPPIITFFIDEQNVTSRVKKTPWRPCFLTDPNHFRTQPSDQANKYWTKNWTFIKTAPPPGCHVFSHIWTIFELVRDINETNIVTFREYCPPPPGGHVFHVDWTKNVTSIKTAPPPGGHVFSPIWTIFELVRDINLTNIVTFRVFTRNTAPPGGHVFQRTTTIFKHNQHIITTNILTKLHKDWGSYVTSTVFELGRGIIGKNVLTKKNVDDERRTADKRRSQKLTMSTLCSMIFRQLPGLMVSQASGLMSVAQSNVNRLSVNRSNGQSVPQSIVSLLPFQIGIQLPSLINPNPNPLPFLSVSHITQYSSLSQKSYVQSPHIKLSVIHILNSQLSNITQSLTLLMVISQSHSLQIINHISYSQSVTYNNISQSLGLISNSQSGTLPYINKITFSIIITIQPLNLESHSVTNFASLATLGTITASQSAVSYARNDNHCLSSLPAVKL
ncbi:hypothetical protein DPMN_022099 [Dreissena polymorpha]|uniref:Uncharacterized protein n=1 Tax=Dreissena polymorpha TaxID=45954 RepID=A0A9D4NJR2_DREPO|nr:hypothetical protein DPMN_022099 [Dreissena polymorpha]